MTPLERKSRGGGGGGGLIGRTIFGRGMDIFWNHTLGEVKQLVLSSSSLQLKGT